MSLCRIGQLMEADREVAVAVNESGWSATRLAVALTYYGHQVGETTIRKHRRGECLCRLTKR